MYTTAQYIHTYIHTTEHLYFKQWRSQGSRKGGILTIPSELKCLKAKR